MTSSGDNHTASLHVVQGDRMSDRTDRPRTPASDKGVDWSILMAHAQNGDRDAYRRLLQEIAPYIRSLAARRLSHAHDIEDVLQETLLTIHEVRHTYDPTRPFGPWLVTIASRRTIDRLRQIGRTRSREVELTEFHETFAEQRANNWEGASNSRVIRQALDKLPPGQRKAIILLKIKEMTLKEATAFSGMSIPSLKAATHRAMKNLRKLLNKGGDK